MNRNQHSDRLHGAVQAFARGDESRSFDDIAREIAEFQREHSAGFARLLRGRAGALDRVETIPGVPSDAFRLSRVAVHPAAEDRARFLTSGTTSGARGVHAFRTLETYRTVALSFGRDALLSRPAPWGVVALAPLLDEPPSSSLGYMMALFMRDFAHLPAQDVRAPERWLLEEQGVNVPGLERAGQLALERGEPLLVLATSFALVGLLDAQSERKLRLPSSTVVMQTGGFKGKSREIEPDELRRAVALRFGIPTSQVVSEYGMTELTSQLYEASVPGSRLHAERNGRHGVYCEPPWLRVVPVDPVSLEPVPDGEVGIGKIVDLGNVDSAIAVQTQDRVRRVEGGIELLGRVPGATPRGCSLAIEEFLSGRST